MKETKVIEMDEQVTEVEEMETEETMPKKGIFTRIGEGIDKHGKTIVTAVGAGVLAVGAFTIGKIFGGGSQVEGYDEVADKPVYENEDSASDDTE